MAAMHSDGLNFDPLPKSSLGPSQNGISTYLTCYRLFIVFAFCNCASFANTMKGICMKQPSDYLTLFTPLVSLVLPGTKFTCLRWFEGQLGQVCIV